MKGQCGEEFKPYTSYCEECNYYEYCKKALNDYLEKERCIGDNHPVLRPFEQEIINNKQKFKKLGKISIDEIDSFKNQLERVNTIDSLITMLDLYMEER